MTNLEELATTVVSLHFVPSPEDHTGNDVKLSSRADAAATTGVVVECDAGLGARGIGAPGPS